MEQPQPLPPKEKLIKYWLQVKSENNTRSQILPEGSTEKPVNDRIRKWKNCTSLHIDMSKKEVLSGLCQAAQKSQRELLAHGHSTNSEIAYETVRPSRLLLQN